jgi:signal peptidase II
MIDVSRRHRAIALGTFAIALGVVVIDQVTKLWALASLSSRDTIWLVGELLGLRQLRNPGAALGIGYGYTWVLTIIVVAIIVVIVRVIRNIRSWSWSWALALMLGGAIGNLIDRVFQPAVVGGVVQEGFGLGNGAVVDFLVYGDWFVGNVADIAIVVAAGLIIVLSLLGIGLDGKRQTGAAAADVEPADGDSAAVETAVETDEA